MEWISAVRDLLHLVVLVRTVLASTVSPQDACNKLGRPHGISFGNSCYIFTMTEKMAYPEAKWMCRLLGGSLVTVANQQVEAFLQQQMAARKWTQMWTGLTKTRRKNWVYIHDNTPLFGQGCYQDKANDRDLKDQTFINIPASYRPLTPPLCYEGCSGTGRKYFGLQILSNGFRPNTNNRRDTGCFCGDDYGKYGEVHGCTESCYVDPSQGSDLCGGLLKNYVYYIGERNSAWVSGYPKTSGSCAALSGLQKGDMLNLNCELQYRFMCIIDTAVTSGISCTGNEFDKLRNTNYCVYTSNDRISWFNAQGKCASLGDGWEFLYATARTMDAIRSLAVSKSSSTQLSDENKIFWMGATKAEWVWPKNVSTGYFNWQSSEPSAEDESCMKLLTTSPDGSSWQSESCDSNSKYNDHFACQIEPNMEYIINTTSTTTARIPTTTKAMTTTRITKQTPTASKAVTLPPTTSTTNELTIRSVNPAISTSTTRKFVVTSAETTVTSATTTSTTRGLVVSGTSTSTTVELVITGAVTPGIGASEQTDSLTIFQKLLIFCAALTFLAICISIGLFIYYKKTHKPGAVTPSKYLTEPVASGASAPDEIYTDTTSGGAWQPHRSIND